MEQFLSKKQRNELLNALQLEKSSRHSDRIKTILLVDDHKTHREIAAFLFLDKTSVLNYVKQYKKGGIDLLLNDEYKGGIKKLSAPRRNLWVKSAKIPVFKPLSLGSYPSLTKPQASL